jgi:hypothetical protein
VSVANFTGTREEFTPSPSHQIAGGWPTDEIPSATIIQVAFYGTINGTNTLLGYGTQTSRGVWTLTFTVNLVPGTYTLFAQAEDSYGVFGDSVAITLTVSWSVRER